jgi:sRNA-binding carbon storage regulator CsrA
MSDEAMPQDQKAGYLVIRLKPGEGFVVADTVEVWLSSLTPGNHGSAQIAVKAPKELKIRRVK